MRDANNKLVLKPPGLYEQVRTRSSGLRAGKEEKLLYASYLISVGAVNEAQRILNSLDPEDPFVRLAKTEALFFRYQYQEIIELWEPIDSVTQFPAKQKIAVSLCETRDPRALTFVQKIFRQTSSEFHLELILKEHLLRKHWSEMEGLLRETNSPNQLKWQLLLRLEKHGPVATAIAQLDSIRSDLEKNRNWEGLRQLDYLIARTTKDRQLFEFLYAGTSVESFRNIVEKETDSLNKSASYLWKIGNCIEPLLDATTGTWTGRTIDLKAGKLLGRLLHLLCTDFYRSFLPGEIFETLYPDEFWNPISSPHRVQALAERLGANFLRLQIPLKIERRFNAYRLKATGRLAIRVARAGGFERHEFLLNRFRSKSHQNTFTADEMRTSLGFSRATIYRLIANLRKHGLIKSLGQGKSTYYQLVSLAEDVTKKCG